MYISSPIYKSKEDTRVTLTYLTEKGTNLRPILKEVLDKLNTNIYGDFIIEEKRQLENFLEKILKRF